MIFADIDFPQLPNLFSIFLENYSFDSIYIEFCQVVEKVIFSVGAALVWHSEFCQVVEKVIFSVGAALTLWIELSLVPTPLPDTIEPEQDMKGLTHTVKEG